MARRREHLSAYLHICISAQQQNHTKKQEIIIRHHLKIGVTMIKPTTSYLFINFFFATTGFVVLLSPSKIIILGVFPRFQKKSQNRGVLGELGRAAPNQPKCQ